MALSQDDQKVQDAIAGSWVDRRAPVAWRPYLRLSRFDRPVGAWLLFLPCCFGAFLAGALVATPISSMLHFIIVVAIGSWLMRGAGCTWNDIVDRKIDAQVERTKSRPLPSGAVSVRGAVIWMIVQMVISFIALMTLSWYAIIIAVSSLLVVAIYPFAKRFTNWPQVVLGLAFNWGVFVAFAEIYGAIPLEAILLYIAMIFWTLYYDTIYAFQDLQDDQKIGVKSTARTLQDQPKSYLSAFAFFAVLFLFMATIVSVGINFNSIGFFLGAIAMGFGFFQQLQQFDPNDTDRCLMQFRQNVKIGQIGVLFFALSYLFVTFGQSLASS